MSSLCVGSQIIGFIVIVQINKALPMLEYVRINTSLMYTRVK